MIRRFEDHRKLGSTPNAARAQALAENRSKLRPPPRCPWWPLVWSLRSTVSKRLLHIAGGIIRLIEHLEPRQLGLDETRERFDRRRNGEFFAGLLARDEFRERDAHVGFVEHALHELREFRF